MRNKFFPILLFLVQGERPLSQSIQQPELQNIDTNSSITLNPAEVESSTVDEASSWLLLELTGNSSLLLLHQPLFEVTLRRSVAHLTQSRLENVDCNSVTLGPEILVNVTLFGHHSMTELSDAAQDNANIVDLEGSKFSLVSIVASDQILSSVTLSSQMSSRGKDIFAYLCFAGVITLLVSSFLLFMVCRFIQLKDRGEDKRRAEFCNTYLHFPQISYSREVVNNYNIIVDRDNASADCFATDDVSGDWFTTLNFTDEEFMPRYLKTEISRQSSSDDGEGGEPPPLENVEKAQNLKKLSTFSDIETPPPLESVQKYNSTSSSIYAADNILKPMPRFPFGLKLSSLANSSLALRRTTCPEIMFRDEIISTEIKPITDEMLKPEIKPISVVRVKRSTSPSSTAPASSLPGLSPRSSYSPKSFSSVANSSLESLPSQEQIDSHVQRLFENIKLKLTFDQNENVSMEEIVSN